MRRDLWRVPKNGGILFDPPLAEVAAAVQANRDQFSTCALRFCGIPLQELRSSLRSEIAATGQALYAPLLVQAAPPALVPWIVTGHQPELFHPGVWLKNFAASGIARRVGGAAIHIVLDTDTIKSGAFRAPASVADPTHVRIESIAFDRIARESPAELWHCRDEAAFDAAPAAVDLLAKQWGFRPVCERFWADARAFRGASAVGANVGLRFAYARHKLESEWSDASVDVLQSDLCRTRAFAHFLGEVLGRARPFHEAYNRALHSYRGKHRLRSRNHPAPDLHEDGEWYEFPFWVFRSKGSMRERLFVRDGDRQVQLRAGRTGPVTSVALSPDALFQLTAMPDWQIRTRALTTTMFARLFLADLFIHGIGGAKYDEVTNELIGAFFGIAAPAYALVTGTLCLPLAHFAGNVEEKRRLRRRLRDLDWRPETLIGSADTAAALQIDAKRAFRQASPSTHEERRRRFIELQECTRALRPAVADQRAETERLAQRCDVELAANAILARRDYPCILYPEEMLRTFCSQSL